jgi:hypothetical protein
MRFSFAALSALSIVFLELPLAAAPKLKESFVPALKAIPDLTQTDPKGKFADGGKNFCGPVAVSNSLMALFRDDLKWNDVSHYDLVNQLASQSRMNTDLTKGTGVRQLMHGVELFLDEQGEKNYFLKFQGWRRHDNRHRTGVTEPQLTWIKHIIANKRGAVWLNVGWYREISPDQPLVRISGHWVTAVGYGKDASGKLDPDYLLIHDPSPRASAAGPEYVKMTKINSGVLSGAVRNLPRPARNLYQMEDGMRLKRGAQVAILDGAVGLILKPKASAKP